MQQRTLSTAPPKPAKGPPERTSLIGHYTLLEPLEPLKHSSQLWNALSGHDDVWSYLPYGPWNTEDVFLSWLKQIASLPHQLYYTVVDSASKEALGCLSLLNIEVAHGSIEIGGIFYSPRLQRTRIGTEAIYLASRYVFDELGYRRLEWKCNEANRASVQAAIRYGFVPEGTFYQHWIIKGQNRNTAWFSILDGEWPHRKLAFEEWLHPDNFDSCGRQKRRFTPFNVHV